MLNTSSLLKCQEILSLRKRQCLKYAAFELPVTVDKRHGYHMKCYRKITALSKAQRKKLKCLKNTALIFLPTTIVSLDFKMHGSLLTKRSDIKSHKPSKTGIFPKVCLFRNKARKEI